MRISFLLFCSFKEKKRMRQKLLYIFLTLAFSITQSFQAKSFTLSNQVEISILTCGPGNDAYSLYGHTAIRVIDPISKIDLAFNYGVFSFGAPNFIYRFAKGETDYLLYPYKFSNFFDEYKKDKRSVYEQILNLTQKEKQQLFNFLVWNAKEENREYRYNFFFDNCSSRVRDVIEMQLEGKVVFPETSKAPKTFRQLIKTYQRNNRWLDFGIDLAVCAPADRLATASEEMFLPDYLMDHFAHAQIQDSTETKDLVKETRTLYEAPASKLSGFSISDPFIIFLLITVLIIYISIRQFRRKNISALTDYVVFGVTGIMGFVLLWLVMYSEHPAMSPNYNLIWAMPLNLIFAIVWLVKKWRPLTRRYYVFMSGWLLLFLAFGFLLPQTFHPVFYLFVLMVLSRSVLHSWEIWENREAN